MAKTFAWSLVLLAVFCASFNDAAPSRNAHDLAMEVNLEEIAKRSNAKKSAEEDILKINEAVGLDLFEGDMAMSENEIKEFYGESGKRAANIDLRLSWRTRVIPYEITFTTSSSIQSIKTALSTITSKVPCLTFRERQATDAHYMRFVGGSGCWSYIGKQVFKATTDVTLGSACFSQGLIIHEVFHALGFFHEQSRPDRDSFVTLFHENIRTDKLNNFQRKTASQVSTQGIMYDYKSIMHYGRASFTANGKDTIQAKFDPALELGGQEISELDAVKLNKMYQCHLSSSVKLSDWASWSACLMYGSNCKRLRQRYCFSENRNDCPGVDEYGVVEETEACSSCLEPMNGHWNNWGSWGSCSKSCNEGVKTRSRKCDNPVPSNGGKPCVGSSTETVICRIKKCGQQWYDTSFEDGWGMWRQSTTDSGLNWIRYSGPTPSINTGPKGDHTTHNGYYAYVEAGVFDHKKSVILKSQQLPANFGDACMTFYYTMNGKNMGSLEVTLRYTSGKSTWVWGKTGHQGTQWNGASASLPASNEAFEIEIKATIGIAPESDIAIDDVFIDHGKCLPGYETCKDLDVNCANWEKSGECHKNPPWMLRYCCKTCSASMGSCTSDTYNSNDCASYVKNYGCVHNGEWMWKNCCKSCKDCLDKVGECQYWASIGECNNNPAYMKENCKMSCKVCKA